MLTERRNGYCFNPVWQTHRKWFCVQNDDTSQSIVSIGARRMKTRPRGSPHGQASDVLHITQDVDVQNQVSADIEPDQPRYVNWPIRSDTGLLVAASGSSYIGKGYGQCQIKTDHSCTKIANWNISGLCKHVDNAELYIFLFFWYYLHLWIKGNGWI
jgi:hypothetical protein